MKSCKLQRSLRVERTKSVFLIRLNPTFSGLPRVIRWTVHLVFFKGHSSFRRDFLPLPKKTMFSDCVICLLCAYPQSLFMFVCCVCVCFFIICLLMFPLSRRGSLPPTVQNHASWGDLVSLNGPEVYVLVWIVVYVCLSHGPVINWRFVHSAAPPSPNDNWKRLQPTPLGVWKMAGWTCFLSAVTLIRSWIVSQRWSNLLQRSILLKCSHRETGDFFKWLQAAVFWADCCPVCGLKLGKSWYDIDIGTIFVKKTNIGLHRISFKITDISAPI